MSIVGVMAPFSKVLMTTSMPCHFPTFFTMDLGGGWVERENESERMEEGTGEGTEGTEGGDRGDRGRGQREGTGEGTGKGTEGGDRGGRCNQLAHLCTYFLFCCSDCTETMLRKTLLPCPLSSVTMMTSL